MQQMMSHCITSQSLGLIQMLQPLPFPVWMMLLSETGTPAHNSLHGLYFSLNLGVDLSALTTNNKPWYLFSSTSVLHWLFRYAFNPNTVI